MLTLSLRGKIIGSLLIVSFFVVCTVGWVANQQILRKFDDARRNDAAMRFSRDVAVYIETYGSWQQGIAHESFRSFTERNRPPIDRPEFVDRRVITTVPMGAPKPHLSNLDRPPFRFYLFDTDFHALFNLEPYRIGDDARAEHRAIAKPISVHDQVVAYFIAEGKPSYSDLDLAYIEALRHALSVGVMAALALALVLGVLLGTGLSRNLRKLTRAVQAMDEKNLHQAVEINSRDEVGKLAAAFNHMSVRVANANSALLESHTQIAAQAEQLRELSERDELTQLYNRRYFNTRVEQLFKQTERYQRPLTIMLGDIDYFKKINDTYSHAVGDQVLRTVAEILLGNVRSTDVVARYGGEEFIIVFPETAISEASTRCELLRQRVQEFAWSSFDSDLKVTMSMGLSSNANLHSVQEIIHHADVLLYRAKHSGRNQVCSADVSG